MMKPEKSARLLSLTITKEEDDYDGCAVQLRAQSISRKK